MAEMTIDMYGAVGKFGNKVFYQRGGKTIARTITKPKNPKTEAQSLGRVLLKAVNKTYSKLKEICDHSFEEYDNSFDCMNKFKRVNLMLIHISAHPDIQSAIDQVFIYFDFFARLCCLALYKIAARSHRRSDRRDHADL